VFFIPARIPSAKIRKAARLLLFRSRGKPGVKGWELKKLLGEDYLEVVKALKNALEPFGLTVKVVGENGEALSFDEDKAVLRKALFVVVLKEPPTLQELKTSGWSIDDIAMLSVSLLYLLSRGGKASRKELLDILYSKFGKWRVNYVVERLIKLGYLEEEDENIVIGWRSKIEIDFNKILGIQTGSSL